MTKLTILVAAVVGLFSVAPALAGEMPKCDEATLKQMHEAVTANAMANDEDTLRRANEQLMVADAAMKEGKTADCEAALADVATEFKM